MLKYIPTQHKTEKFCENSRPTEVPGTLVPRATNAMALTPSLRLMKQPRWAATSPMSAVQAPMNTRDITKARYPFAIPEIETVTYVRVVLKLCTCIEYKDDYEIKALNSTMTTRWINSWQSLLDTEKSIPLDISKKIWHFRSACSLTAMNAPLLDSCRAATYNTQRHLKKSTACTSCGPGTLVPRATKAIAFTPSLRLMKQPRCPATSPMTAVQAPIMKMAMTKVGYPL